ncbi:hypothetical protein MASR2M29_14280 [Spirochaetota bacterium]
MSTKLKDKLDSLDWIYSFWNSLSPYAYARAEDEVVILPPNLVYKTNRSGVQILDFLSKGGRLEDIPGFDCQKAFQVESFFLSLKAAYEGDSSGLEKVKYDFCFTKLPVLGEIALTYRCNNRCRFCYAGCGDDELNYCNIKVNECPELDTDGFKKIIDVFKNEAKIPFFSFTGGEPLLRTDLEELAAYACSLGLRVNLVSNGRLASPERAASLFASGIKTAQVSLEAPYAELHDYLCDAPGAFTDTVAGIKAMRDAGIAVQTNSTLTSANRVALLDLPSFVASLGVRRISMNLFIPVGSGASEQKLVVPYKEAGSFIDKARQKAMQAGLEFFWYSPIPMCIYNPVARGLGNKSCAACDGLLSVAPDGGLLPCSSWPEPVGNILKDGFAKLWFSEKASWFKNKLYAPEPCKSCYAFSACQAACPLYWNSMGYAELKDKKVRKNKRLDTAV